MKLPRYECKRCGYKWIPRTEDLPIACANPKCRSPYWNRERVVKKDVEVCEKDSKKGRAVPQSG